MQAAVLEPKDGQLSLSNDFSFNSTHLNLKFANSSSPVFASSYLNRLAGGLHVTREYPTPRPSNTNQTTRIEIASSTS